ncbi:MAG: hypothetical protein K8R86_08460 [Bacteroidales bacterium]|nr:hypothetical protein [Bacteroidales bacterium]
MKLKALLPLILIALMFACSPSTKLINTWVDPSLTSETVKPFEKVLVIARVKDETSNRITEDKIVAKINTPALPSYGFLLPSDTNQMVVDEKLKKDGFDGLITMRLTEVNETLNYQQGSGGYYGGHYGGYYGGYYRGRPGGYYGYYSTPGYYTQDKTFYVETSIISLETGKLMWSGTTTTLNPIQLDETLDDIIYTIRKELMKQGLIKE